MPLSKIQGIEGQVTPNLGRRNLIINGAMQVAQRGTSSTTSGYHTVDRFTNTFGTAAFTQTVDATVPTGEGFSSSYKHECTTASSAAGAFFGIQQSIEAQNIRNSGWDYTSASSFVTLSFYARSSVAGTYLCGLRTVDGTAYNISSQYTLAANTWKRIIVSFPGNSNLTINNDTGDGLKVFPMLELGSNYTAGSTFDAWTAHGGSTQTPDVAINIHDTVNSTFFVTGVQLEVGNVATKFEHRSYDEELDSCHRYFFNALGDTSGGNFSLFPVTFGNNVSTGNNYHIAFQVSLPKKMRATPSLTHNIANTNHAGSGVAAGPTTWNFYYQNQGWGNKAGNGNANTLSRSSSGNAGVAIGTYYLTPSGVHVDQIAIGNNLQMHFSSEI